MTDSPLELAAAAYRDATMRLRRAEVVFEETRTAFEKASDEGFSARQLLSETKLRLLEVARAGD